MTILRGAELNICDARGSFGIPDDALRELDYCIASIHTILYKSPDPAENLRAYQGAMEDARVKIIGHPEDGRAPVDFFALARAARDAGVLIEVNNSSLRPISYRQNTRENMTALLRACEDCGAHVCLGTDAHFAPAVGRFEESLSLLEELHFPKNWWPILLCKSSLTLSDADRKCTPPRGAFFFANVKIFTPMLSSGKMA